MEQSISLKEGRQEASRSVALFLLSPSADAIGSGNEVLSGEDGVIAIGDAKNGLAIEDRLIAPIQSAIVSAQRLGKRAGGKGKETGREWPRGPLGE